MVLTLYGSPISTCSKRVAVVLHEKKVPFKFVPIDLSKGEHKAPEFVKHQPFGQVPYIDDDGFILYESRAICRYIAAKWAKQGTPLLPDFSDLKAWAKFDEAASVEQNNFDTFAAKAAWEGLFKKFRGLEPDTAAANALLEQLKERLKVYDQLLGKTKYIAGNELTAVDLFHLPYGVLLPALGSNLLEDPSTPNVARWWKEITSRPAWLAVKDDVKGVDSY